jgi:hypothetical protein
MPSIIVNHTVPLSSEPSHGALVFHQWLPEGLDSALHWASAGKPRVRLWLDRSCVRSFDPVTDELISQWVNMPVEHVFVDAMVEDVAPDLCTFIRDKKDWPRNPTLLEAADQDAGRLANAYTELGLSVLEAVLEVTNRVLAWAYAEGGHHWLRERDPKARLMMSRNNEFRARVSIDGGDWLRWCPPHVDVFNGRPIGGEPSLRPPDWSVLQDFLEHPRRLTLFLELLSNSFALLASGHHRSALIEAVSALEVAFRGFVRAPDPSQLSRPAALNGDTLAQVSSRLGFSTSFRYLLPVVVKQFDTYHADHKASIAALDTRHNIVHNGQRDVEERATAAHIRSIRKMAQALNEWTLRGSA